MKIKSAILTLVAIVVMGLASTTANAQEIFGKGTQTFTAGVGLFGTMANVKVPPLMLSYEYGVAENLINGNNGSIGIGVKGGYYATGTDAVGFKNRIHSGIIGGTASFHYQFASKFDTYAGIFLGAYLVGASSSVGSVGGLDIAATQKNSAVSAGFGWGAHLGGRYYFTPAFAVNAELGYGYSILNLGVTFRF